MAYRITDLHFLGGIADGAALVQAQAAQIASAPPPGFSVVPKTEFSTTSSGFVPTPVALGPLYAQQPPMIAPMRATAGGVDTQTLMVAGGIGLLALLLYRRS